jgi:hypothetical protein
MYKTEKGRIFFGISLPILLENEMSEAELFCFIAPSGCCESLTHVVFIEFDGTYAL